jgi:AcrR family transcriptional regulator
MAKAPRKPKKTPMGPGGRNLRQAIIESALARYCEFGVGRVKTNQIAKGANVDPPLVSYYFPDTDDLFYEVIMLLLEDIKLASARQAQEEKGSSLEAMKKYLTGTFEWAQKNPEKFSIWIYFYHLASFHPRFQELNSRIREEGRSRIAAMIYKGIVQGVFTAPKSGTVEEFAREIQGLLTGQVIMQNTESKASVKGTERKTVALILQLLGVE